MASKDPYEPVDRDEFDRIFRQAHWGGELRDAISRLNHTWSGAWRRRRRRRRLTVATLVLLTTVGAGLYWEWRPNPQSEPVVTRGPTDPGSPVPGQTSGQVVDDDGTGAAAEKATADDVPICRPPSAIENAVFRVARARRTARVTPTDSDPLRDAVAALVDDPSVDIDCLMETLEPQRLSYERRLLAVTPQIPVDQQIAVARLLEHLGSERSTGLLISLCTQDETRQVAQKALIAVGDHGHMAAAIVASRDPQVRQTLLGVFLARRDPRSMMAFLDSVRMRRTRDAALAAVRDAQDIPTKELFAFFGNPQASQRFAAAMALGQVDRPDVVRRLITMSMEQTFRDEAITSLLASRSAAAREFMQLASAQLDGLNAIHMARHRSQLALP